jgi:hypothetical protein
MRKYVALVLLAALATLVFAPAAMAQQMDDDNMGNDDNMMMEDDQMMQDDMMSSASSSASASAMSSSSAMSSASPMSSASASASPSASAMMSASASPLPKTGGTPLLPLLSAAVLAVMVGSGIVAARLVRGNS